MCRCPNSTGLSCGEVSSARVNATIQSGNVVCVIFLVFVLPYHDLSEI